MFLFFGYNPVTIHTSEKSSKVQESTIIRFCFIISMTKRAEETWQWTGHEHLCYFIGNIFACDFTSAPLIHV